jgi:hypothetical protein
VVVVMAMVMVDGIQHAAIVLIATVNLGCGKNNHGLHGTLHNLAGSGRMRCGASMVHRHLRSYPATTRSGCTLKLKLAQRTLLARKIPRSTLTKS